MDTPWAKPIEAKPISVTEHMSHVSSVPRAAGQQIRNISRSSSDAGLSTWSYLRQTSNFEN